MIYLDSNVFLSAALLADEKGGIARSFLTDVQQGKNPAATSALTYDEVFWIVKKHKGFNAALEAGDALLGMSNLTILPVDIDVLRRARELSGMYRLGPRDAIHAACALVNGINIMVSDDKDFDHVGEVKRRALKAD